MFWKRHLIVSTNLDLDGFFVIYDSLAIMYLTPVLVTFPSIISSPNTSHISTRVGGLKHLHC